MTKQKDIKNREVDLSSYFNFIDTCRLDEYSNMTHKHHILPKFMGGTDDSENICYLSYDDHMTAHILLAKSYPVDSREFKGNMASALYCSYWSNGSAIALSGENNPFYGRTHTDEFKRRMSESRKGVGNPNYGKPQIFTDEWKSKLSEAAKKRDNTNIGKYDKAGHNNPNSKRVINVDTGQEFLTMKSAALHENVTMDVFRRLIRENKYRKL